MYKINFNYLIFFYLQIVYDFINSGFFVPVNIYTWLINLVFLRTKTLNYFIKIFENKYTWQKRYRMRLLDGLSKVNGEEVVAKLFLKYLKNGLLIRFPIIRNTFSLIPKYYKRWEKFNMVVKVVCDGIIRYNSIMLKISDEQLLYV